MAAVDPSGSNSAGTALTSWSGFEHKQIPGSELRERAAADKRHKNSVRASGPRQAIAERFVLKGLVEWVRKDRSGAFNLVLVAGEPSRLVHDLVRKEFNWPLFVLSKLDNAPAKSVQIYPDRGPLQRKGKGKGRAKGKGKGKGGRVKGKQAQEDD